MEGPGRSSCIRRREVTPWCRIGFWRGASYGLRMSSTPGGLGGREVGIVDSRASERQLVLDGGSGCRRTVGTGSEAIMAGHGAFFVSKAGAAEQCVQSLPATGGKWRKQAGGRARCRKVGGAVGEERSFS